MIENIEKIGNATVITRSSPVLAPTLDELKLSKIASLHAKYQAEYDKYLAQYPTREVATFPTKQAEATAYRLDPNAPTPTIDAIVGNDPVKRVEFIQSVIAKLDYLAMQEGEMVAKRDAIKACTTIEEVNAVEIAHVDA